MKISRKMTLLICAVVSGALIGAYRVLAVDPAHPGGLYYGLCGGVLALFGLMAVLQDTLNAQRSVSIYAVYDGEFLSFGDQVTFVALLRGYDNLTYTLQWQWSQDNQIWEDVPGAEQATYSFQVAEDNYQNFWRVGVTITGVIVPDELAAAAQ